MCVLVFCFCCLFFLLLFLLLFFFSLHFYSHIALFAFFEALALCYIHFPPCQLHDVQCAGVNRFYESCQSFHSVCKRVGLHVYRLAMEMISGQRGQRRHPDHKDTSGKGRVGELGGGVKVRRGERRREGEWERKERERGERERE